jgi:hypothetical protein
VLYFLGNRTPYLLDRKLDRPQIWSGHCGEENISCSYGELKPHCLVTQMTAHHNTDRAIFTPTPLGRSKKIRRNQNWRRYIIFWSVMLIFYFAKTYIELYQGSKELE